MTYHAIVYNVLIASPCDVLEERNTIVDIIHEWNSLHAYSRGIILMPIMWETHSAPEANSKPQDVINREVVDKCDIAVGAFWTRLGTPTDKAESGTIEEIERMIKHEKLVMLYFSKQNLPYDHDPTKLKKLKEFKKGIKKKSFFSEYSTLTEFKENFRKHLSIKCNELKSFKQSLEKSITQTKQIKNGTEHINIYMRDGAGDKEMLQEQEWKLTILEHLYKNNTVVTRSLPCLLV